MFLNKCDVLPKTWNYLLEAYFWFILTLLIFATYQVFTTRRYKNSKLKNRIPRDKNKKNSDNKTEDADVQNFRAQRLDNEIINIDQIAYVMVFVYNLILIYSEYTLVKNKIFLYITLVLGVSVNLIIIIKYLTSPKTIERKIDNAYGKLITRTTGINFIDIRKRLQYTTILWILIINIMVFSGNLFSEPNKDFSTISFMTTIYAIITLVNIFLKN